MLATIVVAAGAMAMTAFARQDGLKNGAAAPDFSAAGTDGKTHTLKSLTAKGPVVLYFIKIGCPVNQRAIPHFNNLAKTYKDKATLIGVINGDMKAAKKWAEQNKSPINLVVDPDQKIIRSYQAVYSPWAVLVGKDGKVTKTLEGGSKAELTVANKFMADAAKVAVADLNFDSAPRGGG